MCNNKKFVELKCFYFEKNKKNNFVCRLKNFFVFKIVCYVMDGLLVRSRDLDSDF